MKVSQNVDDHRLVFSHEEVLSSSQIQSFFSRRARCRNKDLTSDKDYEAAENEDALTALTLRNEVLEEIQPKHPLAFDDYNVCELVATEKLTKLTIMKVKEMCHSFGSSST